MYDTAQLQTIIQIEALKAYGFSLGKIPELLMLIQQELAARIHSKRLEAYAELTQCEREFAVWKRISFSWRVKTWVVNSTMLL